MSAHIDSQQPVLVYKLISIQVWGSRTLLRCALTPSPLEKAGQDVTEPR